MLEIENISNSDSENKNSLTEIVQIIGSAVNVNLFKLVI